MLRKRLVSFLIVSIFLFSGSALTASASFDPLRILYNLLKANPAYQFYDSTLEDIENMLDQQHDVYENPPSNSGSSVQIEFSNPDFDPVSYPATTGAFAKYYPQLAGCDIFVYVEENGVYPRPNKYDIFGLVYFIAVPESQSENVICNYINGRYIIESLEPVTYYEGKFSLIFNNDLEPVLDPLYCYTNVGSSLLNIGTSYWDTGHPEIYDSRSHGEVMYFLYHTFGASKLTFSGSITIDDHNKLQTDITSNREILSGVDDEYWIADGIMYDDGENRIFAGEYFDYGLALGSGPWGNSYDLSEFKQYVYRNHCGTENYKAFVAVYHDGECIYCLESVLDLGRPGGIFDDIHDTPRWPDYRPDPTPYPDPPSYTFNNNYNTQNYQEFNWQTINNYTFNIGGGTGSGGSGDDSSSGSDPNDPGSGGDPGDDSNYDDFYQWYGDTVTTINENLGDAYEVMNNNIEILGSNIEAYLQAIVDYLNNCLNDTLDYIAQLIEKFNRDFNAWTEAFSEFLDDYFETINVNMGIYADNIVKAIKNQVVPEQDVVINIINNHVPGFSDIQTGFETFEPKNDDLVVSIPLFDFGASVSSGSSGSPASSDSTVTTGYNGSSGEFVFNFSEAFQDPIYGRLRDLGTVFILGSTFLAAINTFLRIFGLGSTSDSD